jgi:hypothetical protein
MEAMAADLLALDDFEALITHVKVGVGVRGWGGGVFWGWVGGVVGLEGGSAAARRALSLGCVCSAQRRVRLGEAVYRECSLVVF